MKTIGFDAVAMSFLTLGDVCIYFIFYLDHLFFRPTPFPTWSRGPFNRKQAETKTALGALVILPTMRMVIIMDKLSSAG